MSFRYLFSATFAVLCGAVLVSPANATIVISSIHNTNGQFDSHEWVGNNHATASFFPVVGNAGGAYLYVDQGIGNQFGNLYLMYDYVNSPNLALNPTLVSTTFDVFFQVTTPTEANDYVAQFGTTPDSKVPTGFDQTQFLVFEKPQGTVSPVNLNGSLNLSGAPWTLLNPTGGPNDPDFAKGNFQAAVGFGASPNSSTSHLMGEFQLSIDTSLFPGNSGPSTGLYSPEPAFWSAGAFTSGGVDPPISSGIFTLNADGSTTVNPALGPNGAPVLQPQDAVPEPSSVVLLSLGALVLLARGWQRSKRAA